MKMKVLSPAGDMESLKMAIYNGADEVYLGIKDFNARNNIEGFSLSTLKEAVDFAHVFDVRVFLTVNILFSDDELQSALDLVVDAWNLGVDAVIIQDLGLASLIHAHYPQIEMHASTQMGLHNLEGVKAIEYLGFKRVVLARETPLGEIKRIRENSNVEIEYFVQGALCVCFSGNCYLSSYLFDASGNRGKCKQLCRLPYAFFDKRKFVKDGYLLSAKDFNMLDKLEDLKNAGVDSLKIEGRARRPYYVGVATRTYRQAVDGIDVNQEELKLAFNRGYTAGYFDGNSNIISNLQNHVGVEIGKVEKFRVGKKFNEIFIETDYEISPKSTLKFVEDGKEVATISAYDVEKRGRITRITTTQTIKVGAKVHIISDKQKESEMLETKGKRKIEIFIQAKENEPICAIVNIKDKEINVLGEICLKAKNQPLIVEEINLNFAKHNLFEAELSCELGEVFIPKAKLNQFRRDVFAKIEEELTKLNREKLSKQKIEIVSKQEQLTDFQVIENLDCEITETNVIYSPEIYSLENIEKFILLCKKKKANPILNLPNFALKDDIKMLKNIIDKTKVTVMINNLYALDFDCEKIAGGGMNVFNSMTANFLNIPYVVAEGEDKFLMPYMTLRHCPIKEHVGGTCSDCKFKAGYDYKMPNGRILKLKRIKMSTCTFYLTD